MQRLEKRKGFTESVIDDNGKKITFFKYGYKKNEKNILPQELKKKIETKLNVEMNELGYL